MFLRCVWIKLIFLFFAPEIGQAAHIHSESSSNNPGSRLRCGLLFKANGPASVALPRSRPIEVVFHRGIRYEDEIFMLVKPNRKNPVNQVVTATAKTELDLVHVWLAQKGLLYSSGFKNYYIQALKELKNNPDDRVFKTRVVMRSFSKKNSYRNRYITERDLLERLANIYYLDVHVRTDLAGMVLIKWVDALKRESEKGPHQNLFLDANLQKQKSAEAKEILDQMGQISEDAMVLAVLQYLEYSAKRGHFLVSDFFKNGSYQGLSPRLQDAKKMANIMEMPNGGSELVTIFAEAQSFPY